MINFEVLFLGTGNAVNSACKANQAVLFKLGSKNILIDCGPTTLYCFKKHNIDPNNIDSILFTHYHGDHFIGSIFLDLAFVIEYFRKKSIIYGAGQGLYDHFYKSYQICFEDFFPNNSFPRIFQEYCTDKIYELYEGIKIYTFKMSHRKESLGYRIEFDNKVVAITGDTKWNDNIIKLSNNADLLIVECSFYEKPLKEMPHISYEELAYRAKLLNVSNVVLIHADKTLLSKRSRLKFQIMDDGMKIDIRHRSEIIYHFCG